MNDTNTASVALESRPDDELGVAEGWRIADLGGVDWALERLGEAMAQIAENEELMTRAIERLRLRVEAINRPLRFKAAFFEAAVLGYAQTHREDLLKGGKKKSREFPCGTVGFRKGGGRLTVVDETAALAWAKQQPLELELYRVKVELSKSGLNKHFSGTGEVPNGCEVEPEVETAYVKPATVEPQLGPIVEPPKELLP